MHAQFSGQSPRDNFRDTSILRPPAGSKVAIIVFEDLGCPACAKAHPYEQEVQKSTGATLVRYDFPLEGHIWTFDGAVAARYIQDKINPKLADQFRSDVFASQMQISNREDLHAYTDKWLKAHGQNPPFVMDPGGKLAAEVKADYDLGRRLNVEYTPTIVVVTKDHYQVISGTASLNFDPGNLQRATEAAVAQTKSAPAHAAAAKKTSAH
ncbi:DsbA family protein [Granulicella tundricola]|nr:thioredoxin domain-containing protein [Granulicella tundricola]